MKKFWVTLALSLLIGLQAQAGLGMAELMKVSANEIVNSQLVDDMPSCTDIAGEIELLECVVSQGWGDFNSESYDPTHTYEGEMHIVYFQEKANTNNTCYVEVTVDGTSKSVVSKNHVWTCP